MCGEGGEYESSVFDCPLFLKKITLFESKSIDLGNDFSPVSYLALNKMELTDKTQQEIDEGQLILAKLKQKAQAFLKNNADTSVANKSDNLSESQQAQGINPVDLEIVGASE